MRKDEENCGNQKSSRGLIEAVHAKARTPA